MKTAEAVEEVLRTTRLSKYALAKSLGVVSSTSINQWLRGTRMSDTVAERFEHLYGIKINDSFSTSTPTGIISYREAKG